MDFFTEFWATVSSSALTAQSQDDAPLVAVHSVYVIFGALMIKGKKWEYKPLFK